MTKMQLQLDPDTVMRLKQAADARRVSPDQLLKALLENIEVVEKGRDPFLGMFAEDAELLDQIVADAMEAREREPFRHFDG